MKDFAFTVYSLVLLICTVSISFGTSIPKLKNGCLYKGRYYQESATVTREKIGSRCYGFFCKMGSLVPWDDFNCGPDTTAPTTTTTDTTVPPDTTPPGGVCLYLGKYYRDGSMVTNEKHGSWCYGLFCQSGYLVHWDNFNCGTTTPFTTPKTTAPPTTSPTIPL